MNDREKWRETVRDIRAGGATWWWEVPNYKKRKCSSLRQNVEVKGRLEFESLYAYRRKELKTVRLKLDTAMTDCATQILRWASKNGPTPYVQLWRCNQRTSTLELQQKTRKNANSVSALSLSFSLSISLSLSFSLFIYLSLSLSLLVSFLSLSLSLSFSTWHVSFCPFNAVDSAFMLCFFLLDDYLKCVTAYNFCVIELKLSFVCLSIFPMVRVQQRSTTT